MCTTKCDLIYCVYQINSMEKYVKSVQYRIVVMMVLDGYTHACFVWAVLLFV